ncbi:hypothetical protein [Paenibacillus roseipurpureus]|uniref:Esterase n=1 Tax=Paenibacillus roseopurpureus TaxID=2918901 RepID=A0AA96LLT1_9BACL|nr:hypothetical protein [Paenibacillus sp. MBLB1832]WNR43497.1 hypothetical protein MJB10_20660 [Paenibacillus sp. MBLB1832]
MKRSAPPLNIMVIAVKRAFDFAMNQQFHHRLTEAGYEHTYIENDGGHEWGTVERAIPQAVAFVWKNISKEGSVN